MNAQQFYETIRPYFSIAPGAIYVRALKAQGLLPYRPGRGAPHINSDHAITILLALLSRTSPKAAPGAVREIAKLHLHSLRHEEGGYAHTAQADIWPLVNQFSETPYDGIFLEDAKRLFLSGPDITLSSSPAGYGASLSLNGISLFYGVTNHEPYAVSSHTLPGRAVRDFAKMLQHRACHG